jgi:autotransporter-associated beta strand protein
MGFASWQGNCKRWSWAAAAAVALAVGGIGASPARGAVVTYYPGTGLLTLSDSGATDTSNLGSLQIYLASTSCLPSGGTVDTLQDWTSQVVSTGLVGGDYLEWDNNYQVSNDYLQPGIYNLAQLPTGLSALAFGYSYHTSFPPPGTTVSYGSGDTVGAVEFGLISGGAPSPDIVYMKRVVPSQNTWSSTSGSGSWNKAANWSLSHAAASGETASFTSLTTAGAVTLDHAQSAGSLWFDSSNPFTIASGSGAFTLTLSNTATIWIDAGLNVISAPLAISGSLTVDAEPAGNVAPASTGLNVTGQISGTSTLIKLGPGILYLSNTNNTYSGSTSITAGTLSAAGPGSLSPSGSVSLANATLDFSGSGTFSRGIALNGSGVNTIQADAGVVTLSGAISGSGGLTTTGNGILALANTGNPYTGGTTVATGTLQLQALTALSSTAAVTVAGGAVLDLNGYSPSLANFSGGGTVADNKPSSFSTLIAAYVSGVASYAAAIQDGAGKVAVSVPAGGTLILSNTANGYSGGTNVSGGQLSIAADGSLGNVPAASTTNLWLTGGSLEAAGSFTMNANRGVQISSNPKIDVAAGQTLVIAGTVAGVGGLTKIDSGTLALLAANTYQGGTTINGGTLAVANDAALGATSGTVAINYGTLEFKAGTTTNRPIVLNSQSNAALQVDSGTLTAAGPISGTGSLVLQGNGTLTLTNANNSYTGGTYINSGNFVLNDPTGAVLGSSPNGVWVDGGQLSGTGTIAQPVTLYGGNLAPGNGSAGALELENGLTVKGGSLTFKLRNDGTCNTVDFSFGEYSTPVSGVSFSTGDVRASVNLTSNPLPLTGTTYLLMTGDYSTHGAGQGAGNSAVATQMPLVCPLGYTGLWQIQSYQYGLYGLFYANYGVVLTGPTQWQGSSGSLSDASHWTNGAPANPSGVALFGSMGSGAVSLPGNGYSVNGLIFSNTAAAYTLVATGSGALTLTAVQSSGAYGGSPAVELVGGNHQISAPLVLAANTIVAMYDPASSLNLAGVVSGTGGLAVSGSGTLILSRDNTYSGGTTIGGGTLRAGAVNALSPYSSLSVNGGALNVAGYAQTVNSLAVAGSGALNLSLGSLLTVTGTASLGGTLNFSGTATATEELIGYGSLNPGASSFTTVNGFIPTGYTLTYTPTELELLAPSGLAPPTSTWTSTALSGSWSVGPWSNGPPTGRGATAILNNARNGTAVGVTLDIPVTLGNLVLGNSDGSTAGFDIAAAGGNVLTLDNSGSPSQITVQTGTQQISAPITLAGSLNVAPSAGSTLALSGNITESAEGSSLTLDNAGTLVLSGTNSYSGGTIVSAGTLAVLTSGALPDVGTYGTSLTVGAGGTVVFGPALAGGPLVDGETAATVIARPEVVPEPGTLALLVAAALAGAAACCSVSRRSNRAAR